MFYEQIRVSEYLSNSIFALFFLIPLCLKHSQQVFRPYNYSSTKMMENYFASVSDSLSGFEVFCKYLCGKFGFALIRFCLLRKLYI